MKLRFYGKKKIYLLVLTLIAIILLIKFGSWGFFSAPQNETYENKLFDRSKVHTVDIQIDDWDYFLENAPKEEYYRCDLVIDGETFQNVGLRAKGNNSKRLTEKYGLDRYSLKVEFDQYNHGSYYGLDKFSLDSSFQDNSYLKSWLTYDMMAFMGVPSSLCSYTWVTVNGDDWGLFLAIEEPEEAFAERNFGTAYGQLYKVQFTRDYTG